MDKENNWLFSMGDLRQDHFHDGWKENSMIAHRGIGKCPSRRRIKIKFRYSSPKNGEKIMATMDDDERLRRDFDDSWSKIQRSLSRETIDEELVRCFCHFQWREDQVSDCERENLLMVGYGIERKSTGNWRRDSSLVAPLRNDKLADGQRER